MRSTPSLVVQLLLLSVTLQKSVIFAKSSLETSKYSNICGSSYDSLTKRGHGILNKLLQISNPDSLTHKTSPQHHAMCWLIYKDPAKLSPSSAARLKQRYAAVVLFYATGGSNNKWKQSDGWLTKAHECKWHGINCNFWNQITGVDLAFNNLTGVIPPEIGDLRNLRSLQLYANDIYSAIPSRIGDLKKLQELKLQMNSIAGTIPPSIGSLTKLKELRLFGNYLNGEIPKTIGDLKSLEVFDVFSNSMVGVPPSTMSKLNNLEEAYLDSNNFRGKIVSPSTKTKSKSQPKVEKNICSLKKLKVFSADCARTKAHPVEIECACCTICCNDYADPRCVDVGGSAGNKKKKPSSSTNSKTAVKRKT